MVTFRVPSNHSECAHKVGVDSIGDQSSRVIGKNSVFALSWLVRPTNAQNSSPAAIPSMAVKTVAYPAMRRLKKATGRNQLVSSVIT